MFVAIKTPADVLAMQCKYVECMMVATGWGTKVIAPQEYCGTIEKMYANLFVEKAKNAMNFRNCCYTSVITKNTAPKPHPSKEWLYTDHNESVEYYLNLANAD